MPKSLDSFNRRLEEIDAAISDTEKVLSLIFFQKKKIILIKLYNLTKIGIENCFDNFCELNNVCLFPGFSQI